MPHYQDKIEEAIKEGKQMKDKAHSEFENKVASATRDYLKSNIRDKDKLAKQIKKHYFGN